MTRNGEGGRSDRLPQVAAAQHRQVEDRHADRTTPMQRMLQQVDAAFRDLCATGSLREQAFAYEIARRRLRRELDRVALAQELAA